MTTEGGASLGVLFFIEDLNLLQAGQPYAISAPEESKAAVLREIL